MDCSFGTEQGRFNYRVGAIIIHNDKILMVKSNRIPCYYSIGGRVHMHETMEQAIIREVHEETGVLFEIDRMGYIHENFFILEATGEMFHELSFYYYMKPINDYNLINKSLTEDGIEEQLVWIPLENIENYVVYPEFFKDKILTTNQELLHIVDRKY